MDTPTAGLPARAPLGPGRGISRGALALAATVVIWSTPTLFQHYLVRHYDPWSLNFYRYAAGVLTVMPFAVARARRRGWLNGREWARCIVPALPNVAHQVCQTAALLFLMPGLYTMLGRFGVIVTALLALAFFPDERSVVRNRFFQMGTLLGLAGAVGIIAAGPRGVAYAPNLPGLLLGCGGVLGWSVYGLMVKRHTLDMDPILSFMAIGTITAAILCPCMLLWGEPAAPLRAGWWVNGILVVSAVLCLGAGHMLYYVAIRELGVAFCSGMHLLLPLGALGLSAFFFGERLTLVQAGFGLILLTGAFFTLRAKAEPPAGEE